MIFKYSGYEKARTWLYDKCVDLDPVSPENIVKK